MYKTRKSIDCHTVLVWATIHIHAFTSASLLSLLDHYTRDLNGQDHWKKYILYIPMYICYSNTPLLKSCTYNMNQSSQALNSTAIDSQDKLIFAIILGHVLCPCWTFTVCYYEHGGLFVRRINTLSGSVIDSHVCNIVCVNRRGRLCLPPSTWAQSGGRLGSRVCVPTDNEHRPPAKTWVIWCLLAKWHHVIKAHDAEQVHT